MKDCGKLFHKLFFQCQQNLQKISILYTNGLCYELELDFNNFFLSFKQEIQFPILYLIPSVRHDFITDKLSFKKTFLLTTNDLSNVFNNDITKMIDFFQKTLKIG